TGTLTGDRYWVLRVDPWGSVRAHQTRDTVDLQLVGCAETGEALAIHAPPDVRAYVRARGGSLFVWFGPPGGTSGRLTHSVRPPAGGRLFDTYDAGDFALKLEHGIEPPGGIRLRVGRSWRGRRLVLSPDLEGYIGFGGPDWGLPGG